MKDKQGTLEFKNIVMEFPGVRALDDISFQVHGGEVVAMVGENGAGKSTLLKILNGDYIPTSGQYLIDGSECHFSSPHEAIRAGVSIIYQERQIIPYLSVAENIFMEDMPVNSFGLVDFKKLHEDAASIINEFKLPIRPEDKVKDLSVAYQQMVEIMKSYRRHPKIIAFDEPTASLSDTEIETLFEIIMKLKKEGMIILYVSHRMKEIFQITDRLIVMKDGKYVDTLTTKDTVEREIIGLMVGRDLGDIFDSLDRNKEIGRTILKVDNVSNEYVKNVSFEVHEGEILGFAGLVGAGRTEIMRSVFGADPVLEGAVWMEGEKLVCRTPADAIKKGIALCPEDRKDQGIVPYRSIEENISISILSKLSRFGFLNRRREAEIAENGIHEFNVKTPDRFKKIGELSGGNQQKVILARWLAASPKVLILDEPTKGIDVGAKQEIYQMVCNLAKRGMAVILISSELPEVLGLSDRIVVMCQGHIAGELSREEATDEKVLTLAMKDMLGGSGNESAAMQ